MQILSHFLEFGQREPRNIKLRSDAESCTIELLKKMNDHGLTARLSLGPKLEQWVLDGWAAEGQQTSGTDG